LRYRTCIPSIEFGTKPLITRKNTGFAPGEAGKNDIEFGNAGIPGRKSGLSSLAVLAAMLPYSAITLCRVTNLFLGRVPIGELDVPSATFNHLQRVLAKSASAGGFARSLSDPLPNRGPPAKPDESQHLLVFSPSRAS
jgi:hypothetical protein